MKLLEECLNEHGQLKLCAWCKDGINKYQQPVKIEQEYIKKYHDAKNITHGICYPCSNDILK